jgi:hypothetical protein
MMPNQLRCLFAAPLCIALLISNAGKAQTDGPDAAEFYKSLEADARAAYKKALADFNSAKDKRVLAGEVIVTAAKERDAISGLRMMQYNKFASIGICADMAAVERDAKKVGASVEKCSVERNLELVKWTKLSDYVGTIGADKMTKCEIKARDFANEVRFPPFDFLVDRSGPPLLDFKKLNECILNYL